MGHGEINLVSGSMKLNIINFKSLLVWQVLQVLIQVWFSSPSELSCLCLKFKAKEEHRYIFEFPRKSNISIVCKIYLLSVADFVLFLLEWAGMNGDLAFDALVFVETFPLCSAGIKELCYKERLNFAEMTFQS